MIEQKIETLTEFISFIEKNCKGENVLFRGQQQDWPLLPKIARLKLKQRLRPTERNMIVDLQRIGHPYVGHVQFHKEGEEICVEALAFAQHNGMATRLLDWSLNPLAALWFAVRKAPAKSDKDKLLDGVVWIYFPEDKWPSRRPDGSAFPESGVYVQRPNHVTPQITAQRGIFTLHGYNEDEGFITMEKHLPYCNRLTKLIILATAFNDICYQLDRCGINEATMFPDIGGICKHIEWLHTLPDNEADL
ncbi:MAG: FRG domain-containing protein [Sedimentisphaerales bacterium]